MGGEEQGPPETVFKQALSRMLELLDRKDVLNSVFMQVLKEQSERNPLLRCLGSALQCPLLPGPGSRLPADRTADRGPRTALSLQICSWTASTTSTAWILSPGCSP